MDNILRERRLRWLGHVFRMDHQRIPQQALYWQVPGYKRGLGRPRANWRGVVSKDLRKMGFTLGTCESFFSFESNLRIECLTDCRPSVYFVFVTNESDVRTTELRTDFQFSHKTRQTMLLYAYFTPKVDFKRKFNHHQSFLYE